MLKRMVRLSGRVGAASPGHCVGHGSRVSVRSSRGQGGQNPARKAACQPATGCAHQGAGQDVGRKMQPEINSAPGNQCRDRQGRQDPVPMPRSQCSGHCKCERDAGMGTGKRMGCHVRQPLLAQPGDAKKTPATPPAINCGRLPVENRASAVNQCGEVAEPLMERKIAASRDMAVTVLRRCKACMPLSNASLNQA